MCVAPAPLGRFHGGTAAAQAAATRACNQLCHLGRTQLQRNRKCAGEHACLLVASRRRVQGLQGGLLVRHRVIIVRG